MQEKWMRLAIDLAIENVKLGRGAPIGALVVQGDRIIATGVNLVKATNDPSAHAEIVAIRAACHVFGTHRLSGCELYTSCEPCPMCLGAIYWARLAAYYFSCTRHNAARAGFEDDFIYNEIALPPEKRSLPGRCLLPNEGTEPFVDWAENTQTRRNSLF